MTAYLLGLLTAYVAGGVGTHVLAALFDPLKPADYRSRWLWLLDLVLVLVAWPVSIVQVVKEVR